MLKQISHVGREQSKGLFGHAGTGANSIGTRQLYAGSQKLVLNGEALQDEPSDTVSKSRNEGES